MNRVVIKLVDGLVDEVWSDEPIEVVVLNDDTEGAEQEEIFDVNGDDVVVRQIEVEGNSDAVGIIHAQIAD